jgi:hypothetical protein
MKRFILIFFVIAVISLACGPQGILYDYQNTRIVFGSGGGFTGNVTEYTLDANGNLKMTESLSGNETNLGKIKKSGLKKIYKTLSELDLSKMNSNQPGNMYYFIKEVGPTDTNEVIWGSPDHETPEGIQEFYDLLISSMN